MWPWQPVITWGRGEGFKNTLHSLFNSSLWAFHRNTTQQVTNLHTKFDQDTELSKPGGTEQIFMGMYFMCRYLNLWSHEPQKHRLATSHHSFWKTEVEAIEPLVARWAGKIIRMLSILLKCWATKVKRYFITELW